VSDKPKCDTCKQELILIFGKDIEPFYVHPPDLCNEFCGWELNCVDPQVAELFKKKYPVKNDTTRNIGFVEKIKKIFIH